MTDTLKHIDKAIGWLSRQLTNTFLLLIVLLTGGRAELARVVREEWRPAVGVGVMAFATYQLILWAYLLAEKIAYVAALRQLSIVFGVLLGVRLLGERGGAGRVAASAVIVASLVLIALAD